MTFLTILGVTEILCSFKLVLDGKTGKEIPESSRLEFFQKFSASNFALSDAEDNTFEPLNREGIADLPLLSFWTGAPNCYLELFDKLQKQICRTVNSSLAVSLEPLAHRGNVASLSLFCMYGILLSHLGWCP